MKRIVTALLLVLLTVFVSCEPETMLTVDQTSLSYTDAGGSQSITLTANKPWTAGSSQSWCKVSPSGGEDATGSRISISCDANTTYDARNATITITCAELSKQVSITQATNNGLMVSQTSYDVTKAAQQLNIQVQANVKLSVEVDNGCKDWVRYNKTKGLTSSTVVLDIAENKTYDSREGKVTIKQEGGNLSSTVTIKQSQLDGLFITTPEYNLSNEKHTLTVEVKSNIEFEVKSEVDWIKYVETKGLKTNQIILEVAANENYDVREGKVSVRQKDGDLSGTIIVKQEQYYGLILSQTEFDLGNEAQSIEVEVKYNVDFDVVIPSSCKDWIKKVSTKGLDSKVYTFSIAKNETYDSREGSITFKQKNGALSGTISVRQNQNNGLFVTKSDYEISNKSQTINVEVKANINFDVKSESDWVKVVETKGLKTSTIILSIEENDSPESRECKVTVTQLDGDLEGDIRIMQSGKIVPVTGMELDQSAIRMTEGGKATIVAAITPIDATNKRVFWKSSNENIVRVDEEGVVSAIKKGSAIVTAKTEDGGFSATCTISVYDKGYIFVRSMKLNTTKKSSYVNTTFQFTLSAQIEPSYATNREIVWTSNCSKDIAILEPNGTQCVCTINTSTTRNIIITATTVDGGFTATCSVIVMEHEYVDLGLPSGLLIATRSMSGNFAWGGTYSGEHVAPNVAMARGYNGPQGIMELSGTEYDAAHLIWGGKWRMPTLSDWHEIREYCQTKKGYIYNSAAYRYSIVGPNGNSVVLGDFVDTKAFSLWLSTKRDENNAYFFRLADGIRYTDALWNGRLIWPVREK